MITIYYYSTPYPYFFARQHRNFLGLDSHNIELKSQKALLPFKCSHAAAHTTNIWSHISIQSKDSPSRIVAAVN